MLQGHARDWRGPTKILQCSRYLGLSCYGLRDLTDTVVFHMMEKVFIESGTSTDGSGIINWHMEYSSIEELVTPPTLVHVMLTCKLSGTQTPINRVSASLLPTRGPSPDLSVTPV